MDETTLKDRIQKNKWKIWYYFGAMLISILRITVDTIAAYLPEDELWSSGVKQILNFCLLFVSMVAPFIFGNDSEINRVKEERTDLGISNSDLRTENEGLTVQVKYQNEILKKNNLPTIQITKTGTYIYATEDEMDELEKLKE